MKRFSIITMIILSSVTLTPVKSQAVADAILAVVNDSVITLSDLQDYLATIYMQLRSDGQSESQIREIMNSYEQNGLQRLIDDKLILGEAEKKELQIRDKVIEEKIDNIQNRYASERQFLEALTQDGLSLSDFKKKISDQLKIQYIVDLEIKQKLFVNPQEVTDYYQNNISQFQNQERMEVDSIFIPYGSDADAARTKAEEALTMLQGGKDFKEIQKDYSDSPSIGPVKRGQLVQTIEDIIFKLDVNEVSPLVEVEQGIYIFKAAAKSPAETAPLEQVRTQITNHLLQEKFKAKFSAWLEKLRKEAYVEIK